MLIQSHSLFLQSSRALGLGLILGITACGSSSDSGNSGAISGDSGNDDNAEGPPGALPAALRADLQSTLDAAVEGQVTPGVTLFVSSGTGDSWSTSAGVSDVESGAAMTADDRFRAGSIIKTLVASAVLQQVEAGSLSLDDVLTERLPASVTSRIEHAESISVGMLLGHHSGIPEWDTSEIDQSLVAAPDHIWTLDEVLDSAHSQPPFFLPGQGFAYSNTNYMLLGEILSGVEGRLWREVVREQVVSRAGLIHTSLPDVGDLECPEPCAHGYMDLDGELLDLTRIDPSMAGPSGGHALLTSAADLDQLLHRLRAGELFDRPETLDEMFAFQPAPDPEMHMIGYGLGVMQLEIDGRVAVGHIGGAAGYQSFMLYAPDTDRYLSGAINTLGDLGAVLVPLLERITRP
jgi:D-alanyl-D-alanine carboxypeptidase